MKAEDLNPILRWWFQVRGKRLSPLELQRLEKRFGIFVKRFNWDFYWGILGGVAFVVLIVGFHLWRYFAPLFITMMLLVWLIPLKRGE